MWIVLLAVCGVDPASGRDMCKASVIPNYFPDEISCEAAMGSTIEAMMLISQDAASLEIRWVFGECHDTANEAA